ncbi:hypothetical protein MPNT_320004 [Candidatus Methylacidithermus pantelleriae]|uniref:Uncharacterized protein n=1 Tax=Candidatus Methylacidithermus pantelleriae TaxID=2744239 RepID=A0A8J2BUE2_9BACT|nr:hypothetical protein MPNT_320004 [Candidatus Methylacidithermus pantelleriae]
MASLFLVDFLDELLAGLFFSKASHTLERFPDGRAYPVVRSVGRIDVYSVQKASGPTNSRSEPNCPHRFQYLTRRIAMLEARGGFSPCVAIGRFAPKESP